MKTKKKLPKTESAVREYITDWCTDKHPRVEVQKEKYEKLVEKMIEKIADRVIHLADGRISEMHTNETKLAPSELSW